MQQHASPSVASNDTPACGAAHTPTGPARSGGKGAEAAAAAAAVALAGAPATFLFYPSSAAALAAPSGAATVTLVPSGPSTGDEAAMSAMLATMRVGPWGGGGLCAGP